MYLDHGLSLQQKNLWQKIAGTVPKAKSKQMGCRFSVVKVPSRNHAGI